MEETAKQSHLRSIIWSFKTHLLLPEASHPRPVYHHQAQVFCHLLTRLRPTTADHPLDFPWLVPQASARQVPIRHLPSTKARKLALSRVGASC